MDDVSSIASRIEELPTKDLVALQAQIARTLTARWWAQYAEHPATLQALEAFDGDREAVHAWMTGPNRTLGGAIPTEILQTPEGLQEVLGAILRIKHGVYS